jgi:hypothetical protein
MLLVKIDIEKGQNNEFVVTMIDLGIHGGIAASDIDLGFII